MAVFFAVMLNPSAQITSVYADTWNGSADTTWYTAGPTEFTLTTAEELAGLAQLVNGGNNFSGKRIKLGADIVLNNTSYWQNWGDISPANSWPAIGNPDNPFGGTFDGQGHTVSGIFIKTPIVGATVNHYKGLFGYVISGGIIQNVGVIKSYMMGVGQVGGIAGYNAGRIDYCYNTGMVGSWIDEGNPENPNIPVVELRVKISVK